MQPNDKPACREVLSGRERERERESKTARSSGLGCDTVVVSLCVEQWWEYRVSGCVQEGKRPLYAIGFNFIDSRYLDAFATVSGNRVTVYRCLEGGLIAVLQAYVDDGIRKEKFLFGNSSPAHQFSWLSHSQCKSPIRQTAMSFDGSTILSCCEDGSIWCWDAVL